MNKHNKKDYGFKAIYLLGCLDVGAVVIVGAIKTAIWVKQAIEWALSECNDIGIALVIACICLIAFWIVFSGTKHYKNTEAENE